MSEKLGQISRRKFLTLTFSGIGGLLTAKGFMELTPLSSEPLIKGNEEFVRKTKEALSLLEEKAPDHYEVVVKYIGIIEAVPKGSGIYSAENPPRFVVGKATVAAGTIWYAGVLAHEATHSKLYHDYLLQHPGSAVPFEIYSGKEAETIAIAAQYDALEKIGADQYLLDYVKKSVESEYWNIPFRDRWWKSNRDNPLLT